MPTLNNKSNLNHKQFMLFLQQEQACIAAKAWVSKNGYDARTAYGRCRKPQWLKWLFYHASTPMGSMSWVSEIAWGSFCKGPAAEVAACKRIRAKYKFDVLTLRLQD